MPLYPPTSPNLEAKTSERWRRKRTSFRRSMIFVCRKGECPILLASAPVRNTTLAFCVHFSKRFFRRHTLASRRIAPADYNPADTGEVANHT